jgi:small subunit ribosomal protein S8
MSMSDPIADYLTRIRNAIKAEKKTVDIPSSNYKVSISEIFSKCNFIKGYKIMELENKKFITVRLKYINGKSVIDGLRRVSKPGLRKYVNHEDLPRVRNGLGTAIVSTSKGLMTEKQARNLKIGGEVVCEIW